MPRLTPCLSLLAAVLFAASRSFASELLIDNFTSNGGVSEPLIALMPGATGPTNKLFTGLGTNAIGDRTTSLEVPAGVPSGGDAYVEPNVLGAALFFYNSGLALGVSSSHSISWAAGNFDLLTAVGVSSPDEIFFRLDFGENNFPLTAEQVFNVHVSSAGGNAFYSGTVASNALAGSSNFSTLLSHQSGAFNTNNLSIVLKADLAFAGGNNQLEFTGVSVVPEPSTVALLGAAFTLVAVIRLRRSLR